MYAVALSDIEIGTKGNESVTPKALKDGPSRHRALEAALKTTASQPPAFAAAFLPIGSTLGISRILGVFVSGLFYLVGLVYALIGYVFAAILMLLTRNVEDSGQAQPQPLPTLAPPPVVTEPPLPPNPVFGFVISSLFWTLLIALVVGALLFFLRERGYKLEWQRVGNSLAAASRGLRALWQRLRRRATAAGRDLRERLRPPEPKTGQPDTPPRLRFLRLNSLSPREQVRYYYLSTVRRAGERGVRRAQHETPLEYFDDLKETWPDAAVDLEDLTQAFLEARYSPEPVDKSAAGRVKEGWKRIKNRLRGK